MPVWSIETLKELFEGRLYALRELMDERFEALDKARDLQAGKYEDRLLALNHSHDIAIQKEHTYVTHGKFDEYVKTSDAAREMAVVRVNEKFTENLKTLGEKIELIQERERLVMPRIESVQRHEAALHKAEGIEKSLTERMLLAEKVQHTYVTHEKFEAYSKSEKMATDLVLLGIKEKFDEYVQRYELRQRELDQALAISKGAADEATRISLEQATKTKYASEELGRKHTRNLTIASLLLGLMVAASNYFGS